MVVTVKLNTRHYQIVIATSAIPQPREIIKNRKLAGREIKIRFYLANHKQLNLFNICSMELPLR